MPKSFPYFIKMNMQNPPGAPMGTWYIRRADKDSIPEFTVHGYEFTLDKREDSFGIAEEGASPNLNFRRAFLPEEGHYWLSRDFSGQELRIIANLSGEKAWIDAFLANGDIHKATAVTIWGEENYDKEKRKMAKGINFGLLYGSTSYGIADSLGIPEPEAQKMIDLFFKKLPGIHKFMRRCELQVLKNKEIQNMYGRKRRMHNYITPHGELMGTGKRKAYNFPIQSVGAEMTKLALIRLYDDMIDTDEYRGDIYFMNQIHDEINCSVAKDRIEEITHKVGKLMEHRMKGMPVVISTDISIGNSMGLVWKFTQDEKTLELTPAFRSFEEGE